MFSDWIRRTGFWCLDFVRGGIIRRYYKDIKSRMEDKDLNREQLSNLLQHAVNTSEFYKNMNVNEFESFPVIDKNTIKEKWDKLYSKDYIGAPVHKMATSGSTGTPFVMDWDMNKRKHQLAELIYFNELAGQKLGQPYVYFRVWTEKNRKSIKERCMQNLYPLDILHLDEANLEKFRQRLKSKPYINSCLAYASTYEHLINYISSKGDTPDMYKHLSSFVSGSEVLSMKMKKKIKNTIGCKVIDRYSNEENGFLAQSGDLSEEFDVNIASFKIEILDLEDDKPVNVGELGRIVVTDLYNFAVPLIRYDTGDLTIKLEEKEGWTTKIKSIQGRRQDLIFDTKGNPLTPNTWGVYMWKYEKLKQYQFVQNDKNDYLLNVNDPKNYYTDSELVEHLRSVLGEDANIKIFRVDEIPHLKSGKFKNTVCNWNK